MMSRTGRRRSAVVAVALLAASLTGISNIGALAHPAPPPGPPCPERVLVLAAMPLELNPLMAKATIDRSKTAQVDGRTFYVGRLAGVDVVLAMTRIGMHNAAETTTAAFEHFRCPFKAAVFSGVAGSRANIGDVAVPRRWTFDNAKSWIDADPAMVGVARQLEGTGKVALSRDVPVGDAACLCPGVDAATPVQMPQPMKVVVGGEGTSGDMFGDHAPPCMPGGGDVAGCQPCLGPNGTPQDAADFASRMPGLASPDFFAGFLQRPEETTSTMDAQDMETASFADVSRRYGVPFLGVRAASDGQSDPLHLPGFPAQFFVYRQLAGNNAAAVTIAFLQRWNAAGRPVAGRR